MKFATVFALLLASATAFNAPQFATRAVGKAPATKAVKKASAPKPPPASKGYPSFADKAQNFKLGGGKISGGAAGRTIEPVFVHPTVNTAPIPDFDYKEAAKARVTPQSRSDYVYDDGLTVLERKQKGTIPAFLTGSARSRVEAEAPRDDIEEQEYPFGLSADRFQLLFISVFSLFALVGCLSGNLSLD
mmetsp:Transcript_14867/g.34424  ORF Transcript_14867/g.34424 Transcript_14867/m.34424 type:complete len:189 (-) Transcript_14867:291-857(-)|eukprot:CAMPEP_0172392500 /NCGR_PEP_ID=MMETSP1061-20121228/8620_1 /TAXON_ID=37318 /ORGANISM="Pseudo-nitzschia pungens, Strain cf. pungens" /LENGTH=188 /DNA_ID=CAMNT_0013123355 /DNA_START=113 /DNA_END=679 /DNA_ORIENTATION=+